MKIFNNIKELKNFRGDRRTALTIGNFDGCHLGHQALMNAVLAAAHTRNLIPMILTFDPHPSEALGIVDKIPKVQSLADRLAMFSSSGIEAAAVLRFDQQLGSMSAEAFVREFLVDDAGVAMMAIGEDFRFGHKRCGNVALLKDFGRESGFAVECVSPVCVEGDAASSSRIRRCLIEDANLSLAQTILGRPWTFKGRVKGGDKVGRSIGFPTANLHDIESLIPKHGVYAVRVSAEGSSNSLKSVPGVMNIGVRPTVGGKELRIEVHVLGRIDLDLYGMELEVEPVQYLRSEVKFSGRDQLMAQIAKDCEQALVLLK